MKHFFSSLFVLLFMALPHSGFSQPAPPVNSPEVLADGRITFRLRAPNAENVQLALEGTEPTAMQQDDQGLWAFTTEPLQPDLYAYTFTVDGTTIGDPSNPMIKPFVMSGGQSLAHVPGPDTLSWEVNDVPRGILHRHSYRSDAVAEERSFQVYTPPGYAPASDQTYPVLYLLHGVMDDENAWTTAGRAQIILDNLIARGQATPMLIVIPQGYGFPDVPARIFELFQMGTNQQQLMDVFATILLDEIIPQVEGTYAVDPDREARAISGLSMGGAQALYIGLNHLDRFAWVGSFSGAFVMYGGKFDAFFPDLTDATNAQTRLVWMACGTDDFLLGINRGYRAWLQEKNIDIHYQETEGAHTWMVWRRYLTSFAPLLFKPEVD